MDRNSFDQFVVKAHEQCIPSLIKLTGSRADAEDVLMEALYKLWINLESGKVKHQANLKGYAFTMAKNIWINQKRKSVREYSTDPHELPLHENQPMPYASGEEFDPIVFQEEEEAALSLKLQEEKALHKALKKLDTSCKNLLTNFIVKKYSLKKLQEKMGLASTNAVKTAKYRCKKKLIALYKEAIKDVTI
ncbi:MAG: sigma-70 family RNA polymerase sigma factor [Bacteroidota bacterium]